MKLKPINQKLSQRLPLNLIDNPFSISIHNKVMESMAVPLINACHDINFTTFTYLNNGFKIN